MFKILFIFSFASVLGWIIETTYRCIMSKKIVNPGFMSGCVVPIYGFGALILYSICKLSDKINFMYKPILVIGLSMILLSLLEFISGVFLLKFFNLRLWDYSNRKFNYKGLICLRFSLYWGIFALIFYLFLYSFIDSASINFIDNNVCLFILGIFYGIFIIDLCISINLSSKIKKYAESKRKVINIERLRIDILKRLNKNKFLNSIYPSFSLNKYLKSKVSDDRNDL